MSGNGSFFYHNASGSVVQLQAVNVGTDTVIANGINDKGQISGWSGEHAVIWLTSGGYSILGGDNPNHAEGINQSGVVVGDRFVGHADGSPTSWDPNGVQTDLSTEVGTAIAVNDQGLMVGDAASSGSYPSYGPQHAMVWQSATSADLGTLSGDQISSAQGVANSGDIVGISQGSQLHAVLWHAGAITDLGSLGTSSPTASSAAGINDAGEIVGRSAVGTAPDGSALYHAFIVIEGKMQDLNSLIDPTSPLATLVMLTDAAAINCNGDIAANGIDSRDQLTHAYLLVREGTQRTQCPS